MCLSDWLQGLQSHKELDSTVLEHNCSFHTDLLISRLWAGNILVLQVLHGPESSLGAGSCLIENMKTVIPAFMLKPNPVWCYPLVVQLEILLFFNWVRYIKYFFFNFKNKIYIINNNKQKTVFLITRLSCHANPSLLAVMLINHILQDYLMKALRQTRSYFK